MEFRPDIRVTLQLNEPDVIVTGEPLHVIDATPDKLSETEPATWRLELFTVKPFAGDAMLIVGGVLSIFTLADVLAAFPALSTAVPATGWLAPSEDTATGEG